MMPKLVGSEDVTIMSDNGKNGFWPILRV